MTTAVQTKHPIVVGDIFVNSWGYDQTNVDAYQVVKVTAASVRVRRIACAGVEGTDGFMSNRVVPVADQWVEGNRAQEMTKRVHSWEFGGVTRWMLSMDYGSCELHEPGSSYYCSWYA